jgi:hypothetical protein
VTGTRKVIDRENDLGRVREQKRASSNKENIGASTPMRSRQRTPGRSHTPAKAQAVAHKGSLDDRLEALRLQRQQMQQQVMH